MKLWGECTWEELAELERERTVALLAVGAVEAHGPHLPLLTDVVIAEAMVEEAGQRLEAAGYQVLRLPPLAYTPAPFAAGFAGTVSLSPSTFQAMLVDIGLGAARVAGLLGIANAHLDPANLKALSGACQELEERGVKAVCPNLVRRRLAERLGDEFLSGACHAGRYETSLVLSRRPELVGDRQLEPNPRSLSEAIGAGLSSFEAAGGPRAYFGDPAAATAEEGSQRARELGLILWEAIANALTG